MKPKIFLLLVAALVVSVSGGQLNAKPGESAGLAVSYNYNPANSDERIYVCINGKRSGSLSSDAAVVQWVEVWRRLLLVDYHNNCLYAWAPPSNSPQLVISLGEIIPTISHDQLFLSCSVDRSGTRLAVSHENGLTIIDLVSKKVVRNFSSKQLYSHLHPQPDGWTDNYGIAWNPRGTAVALAIPTKVETTDGAGEAQCVVASLDGQINRVGKGAPVAWISSTKILCQRAITGDTRRPVVYEIGKSGSKKWHGKGLEVGWDGTFVLLGMADHIDVLSPDLARKIRSVPVKEYGTRAVGRVGATLVGIPFSEAQKLIQPVKK